MYLFKATYSIGSCLTDNKNTHELKSILVTNDAISENKKYYINNHQPWYSFQPYNYINYFI